MRRFAILVIAIAALVLTGCGESDEDAAQQQVCAARADIQKQVDQLQGLSASTVTVAAVRSGLQAIGKDLEQIASAQQDLGDDRKQQVQQANSAFKADVEGIASNLVKSISLSDGREQVVAALQGLGQSYEQSLAPIDCS